MKFIFFLLLLGHGGVLSAQGQDSPQGVVLPRPAFSLSQGFFLKSSARGIPVLESPHAFIFQDALDKCNTSRDQIRFELARLLNWNESSAIKALQSYKPSLSSTDFHNLRFLVDYLEESSTHRGFYIATQGDQPAMISLDCQRASQLSWPSIWAHEMAHHLNFEKNLAPWVDEMIAQILEVRAGHIYPSERIDRLRTLQNTPSFFASPTGFHDSQEYAINLLFGLYISSHFGGLELISSLDDRIKTPSNLAEHMKKFLHDKPQWDWIRESLTGANLIRYFALAMTIHQPLQNRSSFYQVPGWKGFEKWSEPDQKSFTSNIISPGGFLRLSSKWATAVVQLVSTYPDLTAYRILKNPQEFKIQTPLTTEVQAYWEEDFLLLINTSETQYYQVSMKPGDSE